MLLDLLDDLPSAHLLQFLDPRDVASVRACSRRFDECFEAQEALWYARIEARPEIQCVTDWSRGVSATRRYWREFLRPALAGRVDFPVAGRTDASDLDVETFENEYEKPPGAPLVIRGLLREWPAAAGWTLDSWVERFGEDHVRFDDSFGERVKLKYYVKYLRMDCDRSPIGIYDSQFGNEDRQFKALLNEYTVPKYFEHDMLDIAADSSNRPPYRWILIGAERGGTEMHRDPLGTSAWVTVLQGRKRWCMFPRDTDFALISATQDQGRAPTALEWFSRVYRSGEFQLQDGPNAPKPVEIVQNPGETVFVPAGWPHVVINLDETIAVTHNYASKWHWEEILSNVSREEQDLALELKSFATRIKGSGGDSLALEGL